MARTIKRHAGVDYIADEDFDYTTAIREAEDAGDYEYAGRLEKSRNAKIDGEGLSFEKTYKYAGGGGDSSGGTSSSYESRYGKKIGGLMDRILGRDDFEYDYAEDDSYKAMAKAYAENGKRAMRDVLGDTASMTGGRASSAAVSAASQAYNRYMSELAAQIPALEQTAYSRYADEDARRRQDLEMLRSMEAEDYSRYRDDVSDAQWREQFEYGKHRDAVGDAQWERGMALDEAAFEHTKAQDAFNNEMATKAFESEEKRAAVADAFNVAEMTGDYSALLSLGYDQAMVDALNKAYAEGKSREEMSEAFVRAQYMATFGDFSGFAAAGFTDGQITAMSDAWEKGELQDNAILAAQYGDFSGLAKLGIKPNLAFMAGGSGGGKGGETVDNTKQVLDSWKNVIDAGEVSVDDILSGIIPISDEKGRLMDSSEYYIVKETGEEIAPADRLLYALGGDQTLLRSVREYAKEVKDKGKKAKDDASAANSTARANAAYKRGLAHISDDGVPGDISDDDIAAMTPDQYEALVELFQKIQKDKQSALD